MKKTILILIAMISFIRISGQKDLQVVPSVDIKRYAGTWYEIARLPFYFESKLKCITATYTLRDDGKIDVLNRGHYITEPAKVNSARGLAFVPDKNVPAKLKVQFFWPFRGNYWIIELDKDYRYVMIGEPSYKYLWILSRNKKLDPEILDILLKNATDSGYDLSELIMTVHDCN